MNPQAQKLLKIVGLMLLLAIIAWFSTRNREPRAEGGDESAPKVAATEPAPPAPASEPVTPVETKALVRPSLAGVADVSAAIREKRSGVMVAGSGRVMEVLPDAAEGIPQQRFRVALADGGTVLVCHAVSTSGRVPCREGDAVEFVGEYEWAEDGGTVRWTHRDPAGSHAEGWIRHDGRNYR
jgi:hypothetical protein